jgi:hypothetical protein
MNPTEFETAMSEATQQYAVDIVTAKLRMMEAASKVLAPELPSETLMAVSQAANAIEDCKEDIKMFMSLNDSDIAEYLKAHGTDCIETNKVSVKRNVRKTYPIPKEAFAEGYEGLADVLSLTESAYKDTKKNPDISSEARERIGECEETTVSYTVSSRYGKIKGIESAITAHLVDLPSTQVAAGAVKSAIHILKTVFAMPDLTEEDMDNFRALITS